VLFLLSKISGFVTQIVPKHFLVLSYLQWWNVVKKSHLQR